MQINLTGHVTSKRTYYGEQNDCAIKNQTKPNQKESTCINPFLLFLCLGELHTRRAHEQGSLSTSINSTPANLHQYWGCWLLADCLSFQRHVSVSHGKLCLNNCLCCRTEVFQIKLAISRNHSILSLGQSVLSLAL